MNNDINSNSLNNIKKLVDNGNFNEAISQISPEMIENFKKMFSNSTTVGEKENNNPFSENSTSTKKNNSFNENNNISSSLNNSSSDMHLPNNSNYNIFSNSNNSYQVQKNKINSSNYNSKDTSYNKTNSSFNASHNNFNSQNSNKNNINFDFSKIDANTILKLKSVMEQMNLQNDPRANLLYSLKPYLRQTKQNQLDQYVNLLNFSKIAEVFKNDKKDDSNV